MASAVAGAADRIRFAKIFISKSRCIFENLAFEEWLFRNHDIKASGEAMLLWSNNPTVVIGRHQNPWLEANIPFLEQMGISLVRRHSGGGAVYHDLGNINISVLTEQKRHNRPRNLRFVADGLNQRYKLNLVPNKRDDLWLQPGERKVSGTAARIAHSRAYHHLTLLLRVNVPLLKESLNSTFKGQIRTNATRSVRAPGVGFLAQENEAVNSNDVIETLISSFSKQYDTCDVSMVSDITSDTVFPGVAKNKEFLTSWEWIYGKTPAFDMCLSSDDDIHVESGVITKVTGSRLDLIGLKLTTALREMSFKPFLELKKV